VATVVVLRNPRREVEVASNRSVKEVLRELGVIPETVLVIAGDALVTTDHVVRDGEVIELRPVMSGGSVGEGNAGGRTSGGRAA
jgi:sulfur carrier protein